MTPPISIDGTDITGATIDGQDVQEITVDGQTVFSAGDAAIFADDFRDNKLFSNRDSYATLAYDGLPLPSDVLPVGRFAYDDIQGNATASNGELVWGQNDVIVQQANFDLNRPMVWEFELDSSQHGSGSSRAYLVRLMLGNNHTFTDFVDDADVVFVQSATTGELRVFQNGGNNTESFSISRGVHDVRVTYQPNGDFEIFVDGVSEATLNEQISFNPTFLGVFGNSGDVGTIRLDSFVCYFDD